MVKMHHSLCVQNDMQKANQYDRSPTRNMIAPSLSTVDSAWVHGKQYKLDNSEVICCLAY